MKRSKIVFIVLGILLLAILSTALSFYILNQQRIETDEEIEVLVLINFGTLTPVDDYIEQYVNVTEGQSAYYAFSLVVELTVKNHTLLGVYIEGVNGYMESGNDHWFFYYYNVDQGIWVLAPMGLSHYYLQEGDRIKLEFSG